MVSLGGNTPYDFIRRCFQAVLGDSVSKQFTYDGTKNKDALKDLKLGALFVGMYLKNTLIHAIGTADAILIFTSFLHFSSGW